MNKFQKEKIYLIAIIILGIFLRLFYLGVRPFDGDEGIMVLIANNSWSELLVRASADVHPPLYHVLLKLFLNFGISTWTVRLLSAICGIIFVYLIYIFFKKLLQNIFPESNKISLVATLLAAISPYLVYPSQEARMYSLFALLSLGSYYFCLSIIEKSSWKNWIFYILFSVAMIYTQYLGVVVLASQFIYLLIFEPSFKNKIWQWIILWMAIIALFIPQFSTAINQFSGRSLEQSQGINIIGNLKSIFGAFYRFGAGRIFLDLSPSHIKSLMANDPLVFAVFLITLIIPIVIFITGLIAIYKKSAKTFWFLILPIIISVVAGLFVTEIGGKASRYFIYLVPFYIILISIGFSKLWQKSWKIIFPIGFIAISLYSLYNHYFYESKQPGVNVIANYVCANQGANDIVMMRGGFGGGEGWVFNFYNQDCQNKTSVFDMLGSYQTGNLAELKSVDPLDKTKELLNKYQTVWFYDLTYSDYDFYKLSDNYNANIVDIGKDKEEKNLQLIKISRR